MNQEFESLRRARLAEINANPRDRDGLRSAHGEVWDTSELKRDFEVLGFAAPYAVVRRRADGVLGSLVFQHQPRYFFSFVADEPPAALASCSWCNAANPA